MEKLGNVVKTYENKSSDELLEDLKKAKPDRVFITHSGCTEEIIDSVSLMDILIFCL